jgi:DNA polymerase I-like protein with 3'-5' exonuclease and polymerase domains
MIVDLRMGGAPETMNIFALDVETTTSNKGDPFDTRNKLVVGGWGNPNQCNYFDTSDIATTQHALQQAKMVVFFNAKFDLHWIRSIGITFPIRLPVWDCQLAEFILSNQRWKYPSLEDACVKRGLGNKIDTIKLEYWEKGIDTDAIPIELLKEYLDQDVSLTYKLYLAQIEEFKKPEHANKYKIFRLACYDLMVLEEMEYNGFLFDCEAARKEATALEEQALMLDNSVLAEFVDVPINLSSNDHVSAMLYGGTISTDVKIPIGEFKTGARVGQTKFKTIQQEYILERIVEPLKGSELAKEGYYGTGEDVLKSLKPDGRAKRIIGALLDRRGLTKLSSTYYNGLPNLIEKHSWDQSIVHGSLNQCVTITGRLSATKPNQQNMPGGCKRYCTSRYV